MLIALTFGGGGAGGTTTFPIGALVPAPACALAGIVGTVRTGPSSQPSDPAAFRSPKLMVVSFESPFDWLEDFLTLDLAGLGSALPVDLAVVVDLALDFTAEEAEV